MEYEIKIKMLKTVHPDFPFLSDPGTVLFADYIYFAQANKNGAICGICENGKRLGVKPDEFEFVKAPKWLLKIWGKIK